MRKLFGFPEEIAWGSASVGVIMSINNSMVCDPIYRFGTEGQKAKFLRPWPRARSWAVSP